MSPNSQNASADYQMSVIRAWDDVSTILKEACIRTNQSASFLKQIGSLDGSNIPLEYPLIDNANTKLETQTDGVGTKVRIYMRQFNLMYEKYKKARLEAETNSHKTGDDIDWEIWIMAANIQAWNIAGMYEEFQETANELMYRMMLDLYAMIVDDFRKGHVAVSITDIIDISHIKISDSDPDKEQGIVWANAMKYALETIIEETQIALLAGETAILGKWDNEKAQAQMTQELLKRFQDVIEILREASDPTDVTIGILKKRVKDAMNPEGKRTIEQIKEFHNIVEGRMELNIGGSGNGILAGNKLVDMRDGDVVIAFFEKKTASGVISPRANGISAIRRLENFLGDDWTDRKLWDFFSHPKIAEKPGVSVLKQKFLDQGLKMDTPIWDVATGRTTVFNPFVSRVLLGGIDGDALYGVSGLAHMTGNPPRKGAELIGERNLGITIDYSEVELPQIIQMCMLAEDLTFEEGFSMWNMGIPYMITCRPEYAEDVIALASESHGYKAQIVGHVTAPKEVEEPKVTVMHPEGSNEFSIREMLIED